MTITSKYASKCKSCNRQISPGDQVNWVKGVKGVTCAACPPPGATAPTAPTLPATGEIAAAVAADLSRQLLAALDDGRALRARVGEMDAMLAARAVEIARLSALAHEARTERDVAVLTLADLRAAPTPAVAAPEAQPPSTWNGAMPTHVVSGLDADDDCPI